MNRPHVAHFGVCEETSKFRFSRTDAEALARWMRRQQGERVAAYRCDRGCGRWHVGHQVAARRPRTFYRGGRAV